MKKKILAGILIIGAFAAGYSINNIAVSHTNPDYRVAIVDIQKVVANSNEIKNLKTEQEKQIQNMQSTINKARVEISKEKDPAKIAVLEEKYRNEITLPLHTLLTDEEVEYVINAFISSAEEVLNV